MKNAIVKNNVVVDVVSGDPYILFNKDIAILFDTEVSDDILVGATLVDGVFINPPEPVAEAITHVDPVPVVYPNVTPIEFKMLFTSTERIAIKSLRTTDEVVADGYEILDDVRLTTVDLNLKSVQDLLSYLVAQNVLTEERKLAVLTGVAY